MAAGGLGEHLAAIEYDRAALTLFEQTASADHRSWGYAAMKLATRLARLGVGGPAEELFHRGTAVVRSSPAADGRTLASGLVDFGGFLLFQARYEEAVATLRDAVHLLENAGIDEETIVATTITTLAHVLRFKGDLDGAAELYRRTLRLLERLPEGVVLEARALAGLARVEIEAGRPRAALELLARTSLASRLPADGQDAGNLRLVEAQAHVELGRWRDADQAAAAAKSVFERIVAPGSDHMAGLQLTLGRIAEGRGRSASALQHYAAAAAIFADALPYMRPRLAETHWRLAQVRWGAGQRNAALADARRALEIWQTTRHDDAQLAAVRRWLATHAAR